MGTWSHTSCGNDTAADFVYDVGEQGHKAVERAIAAIEAIASDGYIEASDASVALAAAELLAAAAGNPPSDFPESAQAVVSVVTSNTDLRLRASTVAARILAASELKELWEDVDDLLPWRAEVEDLIERLK